MDLAGSQPTSGLLDARFLLARGRFYDNAISGFEPFDRLREIYDEARAAASALIDEGTTSPGPRSDLLINNRLEGSAPWTIRAMIDALRAARTRPRNYG